MNASKGARRTFIRVAVMLRKGRGTGALAVTAAFALAGCGQFTAPAAAPPATLRAAARSAGPAATTPPCTHQRNARRYAQVKVVLKTKGGSFCVPEFHDFGGAIEYPGVERSVHLTLRSATKNIYDDPQLGSGTAIFYLNLHFLAGTHFRTKLRSKGGLTGEKIDVGQPYTASGIVTVGHLELMFPPCYAVATQGPYGGVLSNLGDLFSDTTITGNGYGVIEIYSGQQVGKEC